MMLLPVLFLFTKAGHRDPGISADCIIGTLRGVGGVIRT